MKLPNKFILICLFSWLVTWQWAEWISEPCLQMTIDPYSGQEVLVNSGHFETYVRSKAFETREQVDKFIKNAPDYVSDFVVTEE